MSNTADITTKPSEPDKVDSYMEKLDYPLKNVVQAVREIILNTDPEIGEEVKWNAPTFFYTGEMRPFNPKEYKRYLIVFNLFQKDCLRLVLPIGARVNDTSGLLEGSYADGRRLAMFRSMDDVHAKKDALQQVIKEWLRTLDK